MQVFDIFMIFLGWVQDASSICNWKRKIDGVIATVAVMNIDLMKILLEMQFNLINQDSFISVLLTELLL